jgi:hypothetical protein
MKYPPRDESLEMAADHGHCGPQPFRSGLSLFLRWAFAQAAGSMNELRLLAQAIWRLARTPIDLYGRGRRRKTEGPNTLGLASHA